MAFCSKCGTPIDDDQEYCESCDPNTPKITEQPTSKSSFSPISFIKEHIWHIVAFILLIALIVVSILYFTKPTYTPAPDDSREKVLEGQVEAEFYKVVHFLYRCGSQRDESVVTMAAALGGLEIVGL